MAVPQAPRIPLIIVGGGIQGLSTLRAAVEAGIDAVLLTKGQVGDGETLHTHGIMTGGSWGSAPGPVEVCQDSSSLLRKTVPQSSFFDNAKFLLIVDTAKDAALPAAWEKLKLRNTKLTSAEVPALFLKSDGSLPSNRVAYLSGEDGVYNDAAVVERIRQATLTAIHLGSDGMAQAAEFTYKDSTVVRLTFDRLVLCTGAWTEVTAELLKPVTGRGLLMPMICIRGFELPRVSAFAASSGVMWGYGETVALYAQYCDSRAPRAIYRDLQSCQSHCGPSGGPLTAIIERTNLFWYSPGFGAIKQRLQYAAYADYRTEQPTGTEVLFAHPCVFLIREASTLVHTPTRCSKCDNDASRYVAALIAGRRGASEVSHRREAFSTFAFPIAEIAIRKPETLQWMSYAELETKFVLAKANM